MAGPDRSPLVSVDALAARLGDPGLVVVDTRWYLGQPGAGRAAYVAGHIPGAIFLDVDADLVDLEGLGAPGRHPLPSPAKFAERLGAAGIGDDTLVVAYDDAGGWVAARLWWMLDDLGHRGGVALLDGGWQAWLDAGQPTMADVPSRPRADLHLRPRWRNVIERGDLARRLGSVTLLDARGAPRYRGETEPIDPVAGHIPTALSAPWDIDVGPDGRLLAPDELHRRFDALVAASPAGPGADVVTSCGSGVSACLHALAMRVAGLPDPILYPGSYSDWSRSGMPVSTGPDPGSPAGAVSQHRL